jgi:hypothetical protein
MKSLLLNWVCKAYGVSAHCSNGKIIKPDIDSATNFIAPTTIAAIPRHVQNDLGAGKATGK